MLGWTFWRRHTPMATETRWETDEVDELDISELCGVWRHSRETADGQRDKYWQLLQRDDGQYSVSWSAEQQALGVKSISVGAAEACRRVLSKIRGGYVLHRQEPAAAAGGKVKDLVKAPNPRSTLRLGDTTGNSARREAAALADWLTGAREKANENGAEKILK